MTKEIEIFAKASKRVRELALPNEENIVAFCSAAMNMIASDLCVDNLLGAIDTMQQTKAIEDYVKAKIKQQHGKIALANKVTVTRFREIREIGWWLSENMAHSGYKPFNYYEVVEAGEKPKFWLDDLGITWKQSMQWQAIYRLPEEKFNEFIRPYLRDGDAQEVEELYFSRLWSFITSKEEDKEKDEPIIPDSITSRDGISLYLWMREGKERFLNYIERIRGDGASVAEVMTLVGLPFWKNLNSVRRELSKLVMVENPDESNIQEAFYTGISRAFDDKEGLITPGLFRWIKVQERGRQDKRRGAARIDIYKQTVKAIKIIKANISVLVSADKNDNETLYYLRWIYRALSEIVIYLHKKGYSGEWKPDIDDERDETQGSMCFVK